MLFNSLAFAIFLPTVLALYWRCGHRTQQRLLLVASYFFYAGWDWRFLGLIWLSTAVDFVVGRRLGVETRERQRRQLLFTSIAVNLGILGFFKYAGFFVASAGVFLERFGLAPNPPLLEVILPVGISFYTFQTISYTVDVYRGRLDPERDLTTFALYVAYFPQLVAGPIERATHLLPQLRAPRPRVRTEQVMSAITLVLMGLVKKVVIADTVAPIVDRGYGGAADLGFVPVAVAVVGFALQVYGDFSGYTDIARGTSRLLGIELVVNFRQPHLARNVTEFWRRWHISLSDWLREYVYISLGGNRHGNARTYRNLIITMTLGGLWHGAGWNFVLWGLIHGLILAGERLRGATVYDGTEGGLPRAREWPLILRTFAIHCLALVVFRAGTLGNAGGVFSKLVTGSWGLDFQAAADLVVVTVAALMLFGIDLVHRTRPTMVRAPQNVPAFTGAMAGSAVTLLVLFSGAAPEPFFYFQF